jgi:excisionase family DNA binding protein
MGPGSDNPVYVRAELKKIGVDHDGSQAGQITFGQTREEKGMVMQTRTVREVAEILRVSSATIYALCGNGKLPHIRVGSGRGAIRIRQEDLDAFIEGAVVHPAKSAAPRLAPVKLKHLKV